MTREEFFEWLNTCRTHKWEITADGMMFDAIGYEYVAVSFPTIEDNEEND